MVGSVAWDVAVVCCTARHVVGVGFVDRMSALSREIVSWSADAVVAASPVDPEPSGDDSDDATDAPELGLCV